MEAAEAEERKKREQRLADIKKHLSPEDQEYLDYLRKPATTDQEKRESMLFAAALSFILFCAAFTFLIMIWGIYLVITPDLDDPDPENGSKNSAFKAIKRGTRQIRSLYELFLETWRKSGAPTTFPDFTTHIEGVAFASAWAGWRSRKAYSCSNVSFFLVPSSVPGLLP